MFRRRFLDLTRVPRRVATARSGPHPDDIQFRSGKQALFPDERRNSLFRTCLH